MELTGTTGSSAQGTGRSASRCSGSIATPNSYGPRWSAAARLAFKPIPQTDTDSASKLLRRIVKCYDMNIATTKHRNCRVMSSLYLSRQKPEARHELIQTLHSAQKGKCFICEGLIDFIVQKHTIDIDHVLPLTAGGKDDPGNFALTHSSCNRAKQASNLEVARTLSRFMRLRKKLETENRSPNLDDLLKEAGGGSHQLCFKFDSDVVTYSLSDLGDNRLYSVPVYRDDLRA
jgi:hypothetical protein